MKLLFAFVSAIQIGALQKVRIRLSKDTLRIFKLVPPRLNGALLSFNIKELAQDRLPPIPFRREALLEALRVPNAQK
jgi:hypothetical protein